ncbi:hypothetical protein HQ585_08685 [candidate division KSB1 bacterium]|nr:hypothetical protein [candidate division KSB1 bacterium]
MAQRKVPKETCLFECAQINLILLRVGKSIHPSSRQDFPDKKNPGKKSTPSGLVLHLSIINARKGKSDPSMFSGFHQFVACLNNESF